MAARASAADTPPKDRPAPGTKDVKPAIEYETQTVSGWTVHINRRLVDTQKADTEKVVELLKAQLDNIINVVPPAAVAELQRVPLWISPEYPGVRPTAEYHPDAGWLRENGRDPAMARGVEFTDVKTFDREVKRMPVVVLHELAHAYHDRVLGFDQPDVIACYKKAKAGGRYDKVERFNGPDRPVTHERAYAMTNEREYFAECTEAFFGRNDFYPFTRDELKKQDPEMEQLLDRVWHQEAKGDGKKKSRDGTPAGK